MISFIKKTPLFILNKIKYVLASRAFSSNVIKLLEIKIEHVNISYIWKKSFNQQSTINKNNDITKYSLMGQVLSFENLQWNKDYISNVEFDIKRVDRIKLANYRNVNYLLKTRTLFQL